MAKHTRQCAYCGKLFPLRYASDTTKTCGQVCGGRLAARSRGDIPWSDEEVDFLRDRIGEESVTLIHSSLRRSATQKGWPARSRGSVANKLKVLAQAEGLGPNKALTDNWDLTTLARLLGVDRRRCQKWLESGLKGRWLKKRWIVPRARLQAWALANPEYFAGIPEDRLIAVMDPEVARDVAEDAPTRKCSEPKPVLCVETGTIYASRHEAAQAHYVCPSAISQSIRTHYRAAGYHWRHAS